MRVTWPSGDWTRSGSISLSRMPPIEPCGGSRSSRWMWTMPRNLPVGVSSGGRQTNTVEASAGESSARRTTASASAIVASGPRMTGSVVIRPPAVFSS